MDKNYKLKHQTQNENHADCKPEIPLDGLANALVTYGNKHHAIP